MLLQPLYGWILSMNSFWSVISSTAAHLHQIGTLQSETEETAEEAKQIPALSIPNFLLVQIRLHVDKLLSVSE